MLVSQWEIIVGKNRGFFVSWLLRMKESIETADEVSGIS